MGTVNINTLGEFGRDYNVGKIKVHENYDDQNYVHDISILWLKKSVEFTSLRLF